MEEWFSACEIAKLAAKTESKGEAFFRHLPNTNGDATIADICTFFADQELDHRNKFLAIAETYGHSEQSFSADIYEILKASLHELEQILDKRSPSPGAPMPVLEYLTLAARIETTSIHVYKAMSEQCTGDLHRLLTEIMAEEQKHLSMIQNVRQRL